MGVPPKIGFFFWGFEVTYPPIFKGSEANAAIKFPYTYYLATTSRKDAGWRLFDRQKALVGTGCLIA
jgi:hypothetical protein